jgi:hypothetical protein
MVDERKPVGFVSLKSVTGGTPDPAAALAQIREIYFKTSRRTIDNDFTHAIELLKSVPDEEMRAKAHVYMEGLAEMAREWAVQGGSGRSGRSGKVEKSKSGKARRERRPPRKT